MYIDEYEYEFYIYLIKRCVHTYLNFSNNKKYFKAH